MNVDAINLDDVLPRTVKKLFARTPVITVLPTFDQAANIGKWWSLRGVFDSFFVRPPGLCQARLKIDQSRTWNRNLERSNAVRNRGSRLKWRRTAQDLSSTRCCRKHGNASDSATRENELPTMHERPFGKQVLANPLVYWMNVCAWRDAYCTLTC